MSNLGLFVVGTLVTLLAVSSMALLFWGAVLDGRDEDAGAPPSARRVRAKDSASSTRRKHKPSTIGTEGAPL